MCCIYELIIVSIISHDFAKFGFFVDTPWWLVNPVPDQSQAIHFQDTHKMAGEERFCGDKAVLGNS